MFLNMNKSTLVTVYAWARPAAQVEKRMEDRIVKGPMTAETELLQTEIQRKPKEKRRKG